LDTPVSDCIFFDKAELLKNINYRSFVQFLIFVASYFIFIYALSCSFFSKIRSQSVSKVETEDGRPLQRYRGPLDCAESDCLAPKLPNGLHLVEKIPTRFSRLSSSCLLPFRDEKGLGIGSRG
jgi:hypothetical protein